MVVVLSAMQNAMKGDVWSKTNATTHIVRWAVNVNDWTPTEKQWTKAINSVQAEEQDRINRFKYKLDAKASLVGRLLMRFWAIKTFQASNEIVIFDRSDRGRPRLLLNNDAKKWTFNVSHAGDYTVFVAQKNVECLGVDVMRLQDPRFAENDSKILEFFRIMKRQFTTEEWSQICPENAKLSDQAANFFRFWTLKESFVKAIGHGLGFNLQRLSFSTHSPLHMGKVCKDSTLFIDGVQQENWQFEETLIDSEHSVCTAIQNSPQSPSEVAEARAIPNYFQSPQKEPIVIANKTNGENNFSLLSCESLLNAMFFRSISAEYGVGSNAITCFL